MEHQNRSTLSDYLAHRRTPFLTDFAPSGQSNCPVLWRGSARAGGEGTMPLRASVGGAGGARGVGLQNEVFAWAAAALLAEQPLLKTAVPGIVIRVGAQTGLEVDDVAVETDLGGWVLCQVK